MLLNDVEEEFLRPNEMLELYKDVGNMIDQFEEQELITNPNPQPRKLRSRTRIHCFISIVQL